MCTAVVALLVVVSSVAGNASAAPRMTPADRTAIGIAFDQFVKDVVQRHNLAAGWNLAGSDLRAGTTRASWIKGTGVTVPAFPAKGSDFRDAWTGRLVSATEAELAAVMHPRPGSKGQVQTAFAVDMRKIRGRWVVNSFYAAATFGKNGIIGPNDFKMFRFDRGYGVTSPGAKRPGLFLGLGAVGAAVLLLLLAIWVRLKRRHRRVMKAYSEHVG
ncbi:MAG TPA: hypothetical protein VFW85_00745 [Gaiellaceae bacterium]|nr:hypothetical protein [Gaiellaceae bacterium]